MALLDPDYAVKGSSSIIREWSGQVQPALIASFVFLFCLEACLWVRNLRLKRRLPGPFAWPVVGNAMQLGQMPHITFSKLAKKYGNVYQIRLGCSNIVVLNGDSALLYARPPTPSSVLSLPSSMPLYLLFFLPMLPLYPV